MLGPPGSGKGTQSRLLIERYGFGSVATGELLRTAVAANSELGRRAAATMGSGGLIADDLIVALVEERLRTFPSDSSILFDGFPRTLPQGESLDRVLDCLGLALSAVILLDIADEAVLARLSGGRVGIDGSPLPERSDDRPEVVRARLETYHSETAPLIDFYQAKGLLCRIEGTQPPLRIHEDVVRAAAIEIAVR